MGAESWVEKKQNGKLQFTDRHYKFWIEFPSDGCEFSTEKIAGAKTSNYALTFPKMKAFGFKLCIFERKFSGEKHQFSTIF